MNRRSLFGAYYAALWIGFVFGICWNPTFVFGSHQATFIVLALVLALIAHIAASHDANDNNTRR
jgi:branched-subunit amino acid ABC-type transport system permease component